MRVKNIYRNIIWDKVCEIDVKSVLDLYDSVDDLIHSNINKELNNITDKNLIDSIKEIQLFEMDMEKLKAE